MFPQVLLCVCGSVIGLKNSSKVQTQSRATGHFSRAFHELRGRRGGLMVSAFDSGASGPGARFSKLPVITGPVKLFCFPLKMGVSKVLKMVQ